MPRMDDDLASRIAYSFARTTGIEYDDLYQEARMAEWRARQDPSYDPRKAAFCTFAGVCIYHHVCSLAADHKKKTLQTEELDVLIPDDSLSPEGIAHFYNLLYQLPEDGKIVVDMMFRLEHIPAHRVRAAIKRLLRPSWSLARIERAFHMIHMLLRYA